MSDRTDKTDCPALDLLATAYHEAAHAVVDFAVWPPGDVVWATIIPTEEYAGLVKLGERCEAWRAGLPDELAEAHLAEAEVTADLAGCAAVESFLGIGEAMPPTDSGDHENARTSALSTWDGVDGLLLQPHHYLGRVREVLERPDVRHGISSMASALLRRDCLSGAEVEEIVRDCGVACERPELPLGWPDPDDEFDDEAYSWSRW